MIWLRIHGSLLELERGDPELALTYASEAYDLAAGTGEAPEQAMARAIIAGAEGVLGESDDALKGFSDAARGLQHSPARYEYAEVMRLWGLFLVDIGRPNDAAERLAVAHDTFGGIGAEGRRARVERALHALGRGPSPRPATGPGQ